MRETKDQTIARLEKVIEAQKSELTDVKKDRKRLNYAVERLEKEKQKALVTSTPYDIDLICEYTDELQEQEKLIEEYKTKMEKEEERYQRLLSDYKKIDTELNAIKNERWDDKQKLKEETMEYTVAKIVDFQTGKYEKSIDDKQRLRYLNEGKRCFYYVDEEEKILIYGATMFHMGCLIIRVHPDNGRELIGIDLYALCHYLRDNPEYKKAMNELDDFKKTNPSKDELVEWTYHKGMELLPLYRDKIF